MNSGLVQKRDTREFKCKEESVRMFPGRVLHLYAAWHHRWAAIVSLHSVQVKAG